MPGVGAQGTPPWQLTPTSRQGFWLGGLFTVVALLSWVWFTPESSTFDLLLAWLWTVLAVALLASSVALRRRERG